MENAWWLPYAIAGLVTVISAVIGLIAWEPYTSYIRSRRSLKIVDGEPFVDPGACFLFVNWSESGDRTMGPCYIEKILDRWVWFRGFEDGRRLILTGDEVERCIRPTFPHPDNPVITLYTNLLTREERVPRFFGKWGKKTRKYLVAENAELFSPELTSKVKNVL